MKISFLVPTLGEREKEIERLLESLTIQKYQNFEVILVSQDNHEWVKHICNNFNTLEIKSICLDKKGLSYARNQGLKEAEGDIIVLSDDDCWYPEWSADFIISEFKKNDKLDILLTQIYDITKNQKYKKYDCKAKIIKNKYELMSKSSIEIAFKKETCKATFDEQFGLGGKYICGEEVDFLIKNFSRSSVYKYAPRITVYHKSKTAVNDSSKIVAKGAIYSKHSNVLISVIVLLRDFLVKKQNNIHSFLKAYIKYKKQNKLNGEDI